MKKAELNYSILPFLLTFCNKLTLKIKVFKIYADCFLVIRKQKELYIMLKKINSPSSNRSDSVDFILRGARKRRSMAITSARSISSEAGIKTTFSIVR